MNTVRDNKGFAYVYVLQSNRDGEFYTGFTRDLRKRLEQHQTGKTTSTKNRGTLALVYYEASRNEDDAFNRERYLKTGMGKRYLKNRMKSFLSLTV